MFYRDRGIGFIAFIVGAALIGLFVVAFSPFALRGIASLPGMNWVKLSNVGQTYGAVSALIAALALVGIAISIMMQSREARYNRWELGRTRHFEIMRIAIDNPFYRQVFSSPETSEDMAALAGYINIVLQFWSMLWEFGDITEGQLRSDLTSILQTDAGRSYWREHRNEISHYYRTKRGAEFYRIAHEVYRESATVSASAGASGSERSDRSRHMTSIGKALAIGVIGGILVNRLLGRRHNGPTE